MVQITNVIIFNLLILICQKVNSNPLEQINFFVNQNRYAVHPSTFQTKLSLDNIMGLSLDMALQSCQADLKWERWNCPTTDFFLRQSMNNYSFDREDVYIKALVTAAILYTITKECSSGVFLECSCSNAISQTTPCSDDPESAAVLYAKYTQQKFGTNFQGLMEAHNYKLITTLLQKSTIKQCPYTPTGCDENNCIEVLRPFNEIATDIKVMYDEGLQLTNNANTKIMWSNIPIDSLVYVKDSPNFCDLDAVPHWPGMHGRQCLENNSSDDNDNNEDSSCQTLCRDCGYRVQIQNIVTEQNCNCKFMWNFQVQCELCINVQKQFYCH